jgi:hypothetical protein
MAMCRDALGLTCDSTVLDIGGTPHLWHEMERMTGVRPHVTLANIWPEPPWTVPPSMRYTTADGTRLPFADRSFDVAFSNSVIEHVGSDEAQRCFALEVRRVARAYWVQTPNFFFPIEPHWMAPFFHWLPRWVQRRVAGVTPFAILSKAPQSLIDEQLATIRLLRRKEMARLFPDATILTERVLGLPKSFYAVRAHYRAS